MRILHCLAKSWALNKCQKLIDAKKMHLPRKRPPLSHCRRGWSNRRSRRTQTWFSLSAVHSLHLLPHALHVPSCIQATEIFPSVCEKNLQRCCVSLGPMLFRSC